MKPKFLKIISRKLMISLAIILVAGGSIIFYVNYKKNEISKDLLLKINKQIKGNFSLERISIGSLFLYPNLEVSINGLKFHAPADHTSSGELIIEVPKLKFNADLSDVFSKQVIIKNLTIQQVQLIIERDSTEIMIISEAFRLSESGIPSVDSSKVSVKIENIIIEDTEIIIKDQSTGLMLPFSVQNVTANFFLQNNLIHGKADIRLNPVQFKQTRDLFINDLPIRIRTDYSVEIEKKIVRVESNELSLGKEKYKMTYHYNYSETPNMNFELISSDEGIDLSSFFVEKTDTLTDKNQLDLLGKAKFKANLSWKPKSKKPFFEAVDVSFILEGKKLKINGIDLDDVINKFKRSQNFNLADISAVMLAGPAGLAVTKGGDFADLAFVKPGDSTQVRHFLAEWKMANGILRTEDVALSTKNYLVVTSGFYKIQTDSLDFRVSVIDKRGCELVGQRIYGNAKEPEYGKIDLLKTIFGPIKNFFRNIGISKCDTIYNGKVAHPDP